MHISFSYNKIIIYDNTEYQISYQTVEERLMDQINSWIYNSLALMWEL